MAAHWMDRVGMFKHQKNKGISGLFRLSLLVLGFSLAMTSVKAEPVKTLSVLGLFADRAVLRIDGKQHMLKVGGKAIRGVRLLVATPDGAKVEVNGEIRELSLSKHIGTHFDPAKPRASVTLTRSRYGMYVVPGLINGKSARMMVDTGATYVSMNGHDAKDVGLDYLREGEPIRMSTASGIIMAYRMRLDSVRVGGIEQKHIDAVIHEGDFPETILLGMSFLGNLQIEHRQSGVMVLKQTR